MTKNELPPGWYTESDGPRRYWDGERWLIPEDSAAPPKAPTPRPWYRKRRVAVLTGLALLLSAGVVLKAITSDSDEAADHTRSTPTQAAPEAEQVVVPDLTGMTRSDALTAIHAAGLMIGEIDGETDPGLHTDRTKVVDQQPAPGSTVPEDTRVDLTMEAPGSEIDDSAALSNLAMAPGALFAMIENPNEENCGYVALIASSFPAATPAETYRGHYESVAQSMNLAVALCGTVEGQTTALNARREAIAVLEDVDYMGVEWDVSPGPIPAL